ncbi:nitroreductase [Corticibacter populi]|uniref:Nitroreductase n=1 Tax=Corticibacter populi TaxID=1550736 RepID=A0A3M6QPP6_9BURK|nr:nitroreductase [Corticibacter populi]RMX05023.1 nitroreductase [Corticibacter populi]RZS33541.1 nitroreductase [Corticibacter populi]
MSVLSALQDRFSARAFTAQEPDARRVAQLLELAALAPSGGNLQPWRVIALRGAPLAELVQAVEAGAPDEDGATLSYPPNLWEPYRSRRYENGEDLYRSLGIGREDKPARLRQLARNASFFGAPVGIFICVDRRMGPAQWVDLGAYMQSLLLLAAEQGLATCAQGFWRRYQAVLRPRLALQGEDEIVAFGIALGHADMDAPINQWRSSRAPASEWLQLRGFEAD